MPQTYFKNTGHNSTQTCRKTTTARVSLSAAISVLLLPAGLNATTGNTSPSYIGTTAVTSASTTGSPYRGQQFDSQWNRILQMNPASNPQGMIDACLQLLQLDKQFYGAHYYMGIAAEQSGQSELAKSAFAKALRLISEEQSRQPNRIELLATKADLYQRTGNARAAVTVREKLLRSVNSFEAQKQNLIILLDLFRDPKLRHMRQQYLRVTKYRYPAAFEDCRVQASATALVNNQPVNISHCSNNIAIRQPSVATQAIASSRPASRPQPAAARVQAVDQNARLRQLSAQYQHSPAADTAWKIAGIYDGSEQYKAADTWFGRALASTTRAEEPLAWLSHLQQSGNASFMRRASKQVLKNNNFSNRQLLELNRLIIKSEQRAGNKQYQLEAWMRFYKVSQDSSALLNVVRLHNDLGQHGQALKIINRVQLEFLPPDAKALWYDEMGETYYARQQLNNARYVRQLAVKLQPNGERWFNLAVTLYSLKELDDASRAINQALAAEPDNSRYLVRKAQIANASNDGTTARRILAQISRSEPDDYEVNANMAVAEAAVGNGSEATASWQRALASLDREKVVGQKPTDLTRLSIRSHLRSLENSWFFQVHSAACLSDSECYRFANASTPAAGYGRGGVQIDYAMNKHWRLGAGIEFSNEAETLRPESDSVLASAGFDYLPFEQQNLIISINRLFAREKEAEDNTRISVSWNNQPRGRKDSLPAGRISAPYSYFSAELSRLLEHNQDTFAHLEGRKGRQILAGNDNVFIPYIFGEGRYLDSKTEEYGAVESGVGLSYQMQHVFDNATGEEAQTELFLKAGRDLVVKDNDEEFRAVIGIDFNY